MKRILLLLLVLLISGLSASDLEAQTRKKRKRSKKITQRFKASVLLGGSLTQLDGDNQIGFDKPGLYAGARVVVVLKHRLDINIEMLYSQKGARIKNAESMGIVNRPDKNRIISVNYMEIPFTLKYLLSENESSYFIEGGASFSRLFNSKIEENIIPGVPQYSYIPFQENFKKNELSILAGFGYEIKKKVGIGFRYTYGLTKFFVNSDPPEHDSSSQKEKPVLFLRNYFASIYVAYHFL